MSEVILHAQMAGVAKKIADVHERFQELQSINDSAVSAVEKLGEWNEKALEMQGDLVSAIQTLELTGNSFLKMVDDMRVIHRVENEFIQKNLRRLIWALSGTAVVNLAFICALFLKHSH